MYDSVSMAVFHRTDDLLEESTSFGFVHLDIVTS